MLNQEGIDFRQIHRTIRLDYLAVLIMPISLLVRRLRARAEILVVSYEHKPNRFSGPTFPKGARYPIPEDKALGVFRLDPSPAQPSSERGPSSLLQVVPLASPPLTSLLIKEVDSCYVNDTRV